MDEFYGTSDDYSGLSAQMAALAKQIKDQLELHVSTIKRYIGRELQMQFVPRIEFHRYNAGGAGGAGARGKNSGGREISLDDDAAAIVIEDIIQKTESDNSIN